MYMCVCMHNVFGPRNTSNLVANCVIVNDCNQPFKKTQTPNPMALVPFSKFPLHASWQPFCQWFCQWPLPCSSPTKPSGWSWSWSQIGTSWSNMKVVTQLVAWELALVDHLESLTRAKMAVELLEGNSVFAAHPHSHSQYVRPFATVPCSQPQVCRLWPSAAVPVLASVLLAW